jgi:transposase
MRAKPWEVPDGLWQRIEPLLPKKPRRFRYPGRKPLTTGPCCRGSCSCCTPGSAGSTCRRSSASARAWRRLRAWHQAGVWEKLHELLLAELHAADQLKWERAMADSSHLQAKKEAPRQVRARSIGAVAAASTTCS